MIKNFRERVLEESFQEKYDNFLNKGKDFVKNNPYLTAGAGGLAAGALLNYMGDGADDLKASREDDIDKFIDKDAREELAASNSLKYKPFSEYRDNLFYGSGKGTGILIPGNTEDSYPLTSADEHLVNLKRLHNLDPRLGNGLTSEDFSARNSNGLERPNYLQHQFDKFNNIDGFKATPTTDSKTDFENYSAQKLAEIRDLSKDEILKQIGQNKELNNDLGDMRSDVDHATRDSYLKKTLGGAALGAGGAFAKRKLDERR